MRFPVVVVVAFTVFLLSPFANAAAVPTTGPSAGGPDAVLSGKGLIRSGILWLAPAELQMRDGLRAMRLAKKKFDDNNAKRTQLESQLRQASNAITDLTARQLDVTRQLNQAQNNQRSSGDLFRQSQVLNDQLKQAERFQDDCRKELYKLDAPRDDYVVAVLDLSDKMEAAVRFYDAMAADPEVTAALAKLNARGGPKFRLGPSGAFAEELPGVRKERANVNTAAIKFNTQSHVPMVDVTLNGKLTIPMVLDSGASMVCLSWDVADRLGIAPNANDPVVTSILADGRQVMSYAKVLDNVRLGPFTAEKVTCLVSSRAEKGAPNLLGGTFLQNFVYKMDLANAEIRISQIVGKGGSADSKNVSAASAPPAIASGSPGIGSASVPAGSTPAAPRGSSPDSAAPGAAAGPVAMAPPKPPVAPTTPPAATAAPKPLSPQDQKIVEDGWTVLFRSAYPGHWGTPVHDSKSYSIEFDQAPPGMRYLRMRSPTGETVIIPLTIEQLESGVMFDSFGWDGRDLPHNHAKHLGIFVKSMPCTESGSVDIAQTDENTRLTGYGFGSRLGLDDHQGYVWAGKPIDKGVFEIAVTDRDLTDAEREKMGGN